jgi:two-component system sensor histidine kinase KdpD
LCFERRNRWRGTLVGCIGVALVAAGFWPFRHHTGDVTVALALTAPVVVAALLGDRMAAFITALAATAVIDFAFVAPVGSLRIALLRDAATMAVFVVVAVATGGLVAREASRRRAESERANEYARMHEALQRAVAERDRLERETRRLAVLEEVDRQRAALLRAVSHDLRTPLGTILSVTTDLRAGTAYEPTTHAELLDLVVREAERLDRIVTNLLSLSRIEAGAFDPEVQVADLADIVGAATARLGSLFGNCELAVDVPDDLPPITVDYTQIDLVVTNLLENAVRHAPTGSVVTLRAAADTTHISFEIIDEGPGVDAALRDTVFEPFRSGRGSTGVGLAICRAIVEAHGGTIRIGAADRPGGRFVVTLPVAG